MSLPSPDALRAAALRLPRLPSPPAENGPLLIGVSGGADSVYLLCALWADEAVRPRLRVAHFDHRVRGEASAEDAQFVQALCAALEVPCFLGARAGLGGPASEAALRAARDTFFRLQRKAQDAHLLCTAHHLDDVVETVLLRLARGAGLAGLSAPRGLQEFRDGHRRWRPLILAGLRKAELVDALTAAGIPWREDATNLLPVATRNRIRAWLSAGATEAMGAGYVDGFARSVRIIGEAQTALVEWGRSLGCVARPDGALPVARLIGQPVALLQACLRDYFGGQGHAEPGLKPLADLVAAIQTGADARASVAGRVYTLKAGVLSADTAVPAFGPTLRPLVLGEVDDESGLQATLVDVDESLWASLSQGDISPACEVYLVPPVCPLNWRGRVEGDRYRPLGAPGAAKLSDLLINRKIPAETREALPVVLAGEAILWVPGLPPAEALRLTGPRRGALRLTWLNPCLD
jgi:tRNA(Ile)-lysidine synthase